MKNNFPIQLKLCGVMTLLILMFQTWRSINSYREGLASNCFLTTKWARVCGRPSPTDIALLRNCFLLKKD
jgi:hypothetical protein